MLVPKLRFKEFNTEYKNNLLSEITSNVASGKVLINTGFGKYNVYGSTGIINKAPTFDYSGKKILVARVGANAGTVNKINEKCCISDNTLVIEVNSIIENDYLYYYLDYYNLKRLIFGSGQPLITGGQLKKINVNFPNEKEQIKIANFLSLLDKKIELQTKKIEVLKLYKIYTKNELLKNGDKICNLSEILTKWNERNKFGEITYVESISNKYGFISQNEQFEDRNVASKDLNNYYVIKKNVFGYNPSRLNVGSLALKEDDKISVVSPLYECFTTNQNSKFLLEWFNSIYFKKGTISKFEGGVRNTLNFKNLCDIEIYLPTKEKQNKYSEYFQCFDKKISLECNKLDRLVSMKKGIMQDMFI